MNIQQARIVGDLIPLVMGAKLKSVQKDPEKMKSVNQMLVKIATQAMTHFIRGNLFMFDALVSDQACQLRTSKVLQIYAHKSSLKGHHEKLLQALQGNDEGEKLTDDDKFLFLSHLLCLTKKEGTFEKTREKNLSELVVDNRLEDKEVVQIVYNAKQELSKRSIDFLKNEAKELSLPGDREAEKKMLKSVINRGIINHRSIVQVSPLYFNMQILLENMRSRKTPLIFIINCIAKKTVLKIAIRSLDKVTFREMKYLDAHERKGAMVIEGISKTHLSANLYREVLLGNESQEDRIEHYPFSRVMEILLTSAAKHPQYVNKGKDPIEIPLFQIKIQGTSMTPASLFDEVFKKAVEQNQNDYGSILNEMIKNSESPRKLSNGLKSIFNEDTGGVEVMCEAYVRRRVLENRAEMAGLCAENPQIFAIKHIYPDLLGNHKIGEMAVEFANYDHDDSKSEEPDEQ